MVEYYFPNWDMELDSVVDNGTSITFHFKEPHENEKITLSDIALAKALGVNMKDYQRKDFVEVIADLFMQKQKEYFTDPWRFPVPGEWYRGSKISISELAKDNYLSTVGIPYIMDIDSGIMRMAFIKELCEGYLNGIIPGRKLPENIQWFRNNPNELFRDYPEYKPTPNNKGVYA